MNERRFDEKHDESIIMCAIIIIIEKLSREKKTSNQDKVEEKKLLEICIYP